MKDIQALLGLFLYLELPQNIDSLSLRFTQLLKTADVLPSPVSQSIVSRIFWRRLKQRIRRCVA